MDAVAVLESRDETAGGLKRRRPALACTRCRRRKIRCDHKIPCNNCFKANITNCQYAESHSPVGRVPRSKPPLQKETPRSIAPRPTQLVPSLQSPSASDIEVLVSRVGSLEKSISALARPSHNSDIRHGGVGDGHHVPAVEPTNKERPGPDRHWFVNQSSWINHTSLCSRVLRCLSKAQADNLDFRHSMSQCTALGQRISTQITSKVNPTPERIGRAMPSKPVADQLLNAYFRAFDGVFRLLHAPSFLVEYDDYWREPSAARDVFVLQVQVCMALGTMASNDPLQFGHAPTQWLMEASSWVERSSGWSQRHQPNLEELQLSCLLCLAEISGPKTERLCWVNVGDLVRKAMALNLHRDPLHLDIHKPQDIEMRRRLWATIMELNLLVSLQAAQPPLISPADWDTRAPGAVFDDEPVSAGQGVENFVSSAQQFLYASLRLRSLIASRVSMSGKAIPYSDILGLHKELAQAHEQLKKGLEAKDNAAASCRSHCLLADIVFSRYFLALHLPLLGQSPKDPAFYFSRRACADFAIKMLGSCGIVDAANYQADAGVQQLFVNNSGLFRGLAIQPMYTVLLELASAAEELFDSMGGLPAWDAAEIHHYAKQIQTWMENRLQAGSSEVHGCCFVAACRAYATALTTGPESDADKAMIDAALQTSHGSQDRLAEALDSLERACSRYSTPIAEPIGAEVVAADTGSLYGGWQDTFTMTGADDFFGFDWSLLMEPGMPPMEESDVQQAMP